MHTYGSRGTGHEWAVQPAAASMPNEARPWPQEIPAGAGDVDEGTDLPVRRLARLPTNTTPAARVR